MKKIITLILIVFTYFCLSNEFTKTNADTNLRNYKPIKLAKVNLKVKSFNIDK